MYIVIAGKEIHILLSNNSHLSNIYLCIYKLCNFLLFFSISAIKFRQLVSLIFFLFYFFNGIKTKKPFYNSSPDNKTFPSMKLPLALVSLFVVNACSLTLTQPVATPEPSLAFSTALSEPTQHLFKRQKEVIINKDHAKHQAQKTSSSSSIKPPDPWYRTVDGQVEIVRPTVIAGVTISAKPPKTTDPLQEWVSLDKTGKPKTIRPEIKNGRTKKRASRL